MGKLEGLLYRRATKIVSVFPDATSHFASFGVQPEDVAFIPLGVDIESLPQPRPPPSREDCVVTYVGAMGPPNSLGTLIHAVATIYRRSHARLIFRLVGDGREKANLEQRVEAEGIRNLTFAPYVPKSEVFDVLTDADILVLCYRKSSLYRFGMSSNKLSDYMAAGRPIVFASSASNDPVSEAGAGFTVPAGDHAALADAIERMAGLSREERWMMGLKGRRWVEANRNATSLASDMESVLLDAVERNHRETAAGSGSAEAF